MEKECNYCHNIIQYNNYRIFAAHKTNCKSNPCYKIRLIKISNRFKEKRIKIINACKKCGKSFIIIIPPKGFKNQYCSRQCANSKDHTELTKIKIATSLTKTIGVKRIKFKCLFCNSEKIKKETSKQKYCSVQCVRSAHHKAHMDSLKAKEKYYNDTKFKFNVYKFPNKFDLDSLKLAGWYNRISNPLGMTRDHLISKYDGFKRNISPKIISHPANCKIIQFNENRRKNTKSSITLSELKQRIKSWNNT